MTHILTITFSFLQQTTTKWRMKLRSLKTNPRMHADKINKH